jgi:hypothetical protein
MGQASLAYDVSQQTLGVNPQTGKILVKMTYRSKKRETTI